MAPVDPAVFVPDPSWETVRAEEDGVRYEIQLLARKKKKVAAILAVSEQWGIGLKNDLPWSLPYACMSPLLPMNNSHILGLSLRISSGRHEEITVLRVGVSMQQ